MESLSSTLESFLRGSSEYEQSVADESTDSGQAGDLDCDFWGCVESLNGGADSFEARAFISSRASCAAVFSCSAFIALYSASVIVCTSGASVSLMPT